MENSEIRQCKIRNKQYYRKVGLRNPQPTTHCFSRPADEEKSKAAFVCRFRTKTKAINSWRNPFSKSCINLQPEGKGDKGGRGGIHLSHAFNTTKINRRRRPPRTLGRDKKGDARLPSRAARCFSWRRPFFRTAAAFFAPAFAGHLSSSVVVCSRACM